MTGEGGPKHVSKTVNQITRVAPVFVIVPNEILKNPIGDPAQDFSIHSLDIRLLRTVICLLQATEDLQREAQVR